jgi:hypothetical protein
LHVVVGHSVVVGLHVVVGHSVVVGLHVVVQSSTAIIDCAATPQTITSNATASEVFISWGLRVSDVGEGESVVRF